MRMASLSVRIPGATDRVKAHRRRRASLHVSRLRKAHKATGAGAYRAGCAQPGERIGTLAWNGYRHLEAYYGTTGFGAVCHTINPRLFPEQIAWIINDADDSYVLFDTTFAQLIEYLAPLCPKVCR